MTSVVRLTCVYCGKSFMTRDKNKKYCNLKCQELDEDGLITSTPKKEKPKKEYPSKKCPVCGIRFFKRKVESTATFRKKTCCSQKCGQQLRAKKKRGRL
jgi:hypothetical protein